MSAEGAVPSTGARRPLTLLAAVALAAAVVAAIALLYARGERSEHTWEVLSVESPDKARVALVMGRTCDEGPCQSLWIGSSREAATPVATLGEGSERCDEIAWTPDGKRVAFLVNGYQLRVYDADSLRPAGQVRLIEPDGAPSTRIVRGVTFSENGRAVTFDDCPRGRSGCRSGLAAVPQ
jgi:hypothetical protein